ncbi:hypothetical protein ATANTOWER_008195, partial [Ataeniobius toweri]|nr:hypothetical protein [Ataeniobius toweri]
MLECMVTLEELQRSSAQVTILQNWLLQALAADTGISILFPLACRVCLTGPWFQGWLEAQWGPAARREGPAGYKGEKRTGETAPRDPTAAGDSGWWPGDD